MNDNVVSLGRRNCPICGAAAVQEFRPFCSRRCADIDLGRWFGGAYAIPAVEPPDGADLPSAGDDERSGDGEEDDGFLL